MGGLSLPAKTHGMSKTRVYQIWVNMRARCNCPTHPQWPRYGGRGITVCDTWSSFDQFYADMGEPPPGLTLCRKDNDKGYSKSNCLWGTQQSCNRRPRPNKTGYTGVSKTASGKYAASVALKGRRYYLGCFETIKEAAEVAKKARE